MNNQAQDYLEPCVYSLKYEIIIPRRHKPKNLTRRQKGVEELIRPLPYNFHTIIPIDY